MPRRRSRRPPGKTLTTPAGKPACSASAANATMLAGVCSAGLSDHGVASRERGAKLPAGKQDRGIPGQDRSHDPDRLAPRIGQRILAIRNLLAVELVGGAGEEVSQSAARCISPACRHAACHCRGFRFRPGGRALLRNELRQTVATSAPRAVGSICPRGPTSAARAAATALSTSAASAYGDMRPRLVRSRDRSVAMARPECGATHSPPMKRRSKRSSRCTHDAWPHTLWAGATYGKQPRHHLSNVGQRPQRPAISRASSPEIPAGIAFELVEHVVPARAPLRAIPDDTAHAYDRSCRQPSTSELPGNAPDNPNPGQPRPRSSRRA